MISFKYLNIKTQQTARQLQTITDNYKQLQISYFMLVIMMNFYEYNNNMQVYC